MPSLLNEEQTVALRPGERQQVRLKLKDLDLALALGASRPGAETVDLVVEELLGPYELRHVRETAEGRRFEEPAPGPGGTVAVRFELGHDKLVWTSEGMAAHAVSLERGRWQEGALAVVLKETDVKF